MTNEIVLTDTLKFNGGVEDVMDGVLNEPLDGSQSAKQSLQSIGDLQPVARMECLDNRTCLSLTLREAAYKRFIAGTCGVQRVRLEDYLCIACSTALWPAGAPESGRQLASMTLPRLLGRTERSHRTARPTCIDRLASLGGGRCAADSLAGLSTILPAFRPWQHS